MKNEHFCTCDDCLRVAYENGIGRRPELDKVYDEIEKLLRDHIGGMSLSQLTAWVNLQNALAAKAHAERRFGEQLAIYAGQIGARNMVQARFRELHGRIVTARQANGVPS